MLLIAYEMQMIQTLYSTDTFQTAPAHAIRLSKHLVYVLADPGISCH